MKLEAKNVHKLWEQTHIVWLVEYAVFGPLHLEPCTVFGECNSDRFWGGCLNQGLRK